MFILWRSSIWSGSKKMRFRTRSSKHLWRLMWEPHRDSKLFSRAFMVHFTMWACSKIVYWAAENMNEEQLSGWENFWDFFHQSTARVHVRSTSMQFPCMASSICHFLLTRALGLAQLRHRIRRRNRRDLHVSGLCEPLKFSICIYIYTHLIFKYNICIQIEYPIYIYSYNI